MLRSERFEIFQREPREAPHRSAWPMIPLVSFVEGRRGTWEETDMRDKLYSKMCP